LRYTNEMEEVLKSIQPVIDDSKHVSINEQAVSDFARSLGKEDFLKLEIAERTILENDSEEDEIAFKTVFNTINFCYWGDPKWEVDIKGKKFDGAHGLILAVKKAIENVYNLLSPDYLVSMSKRDWHKIAGGNIEIPLSKERLQLLRSLGMSMQKFNGSFKEMLGRADYDCLKLVGLLTKEVPDFFNDAVDYHGKEVGFYKRAQLLADNLHSLGSRDYFPGR